MPCLTSETHILPQGSPTVSHPSIYSPPVAQVPTLALSLCLQLTKLPSVHAVLFYKHTPAQRKPPTPRVHPKYDLFEMRGSVLGLTVANVQLGDVIKQHN